MAKVIVEVPKSKDKRKKSWAKVLEAVDASQSNGYAFVGGWLRRGERAELPVGTYVLLYDEPGSMKHWYPEVELLKVTEAGLETVYRYEGKSGERSWALAVRDTIAEFVNAGKPEAENPLAGFSDEELIAELVRRGFTVTK